MLPGPDRIMQCPYCQNQFRQRTLMSGNTLGATFWTDGKREAPMLPDSVVVSFCEECGSYFWVEEALEKLNKINDPEYDNAKQCIIDLAEKGISELRELKI